MITMDSRKQLRHLQVTERGHMVHKGCCANGRKSVTRLREAQVCRTLEELKIRILNSKL